VVLCRGSVIDADDLLLTSIATPGDSEIQPPPGEEEFLPASLAEIEQRYILATLNYTGWNKSRAASILGIERSTLDRKIRRYGIIEDAPNRG
jgi:DNA-binding NtrC family response regulator